MSFPHGHRGGGPGSARADQTLRALKALRALGRLLVLDLRVLGLLILGLVTLLTGCARQAPSDREVWAEVDGKPIYHDQVDKYYHTRMAPGSDPGSEEQALSSQTILLAPASHSQITVSEAEVDTKIAQLESPYSKQEFQKKLGEQGLDRSDLEQQVRESLIVEKLINKEISARLTVSDGEIAGYYERNRDSFNVSETQYHLAQIEVTPAADPQARNLKNDYAGSPAAAQRKIEKVYARLRAGADF